MYMDDTQSTLFYSHGGGFISGSKYTHRKVTRDVSTPLVFLGYVSAKFTVIDMHQKSGGNCLCRIHIGP